jgi:hypothetical protein
MKFKSYYRGILLIFFFVILFSSCKKSNVPSKEEPNIKDPIEEPDRPNPPKEETAVAFPGAEGFGKVATGGRGGKIIKVTNLNDSGTGSLRAAIEADGPRIVVFEVSGNIELTRRLSISKGNLTIAGQTAPGDGICIKNYDVYIGADNVIIRFIRFRLGDLVKAETDAIWGRNQKNIIIDHCSMSWSIDECSSFYANQNFTMQWCLLAESLNKSFHEKDNHGYGGIWGGNRASFHHNLLAHHTSRNPRFDGGHRSGTGSSGFGIDKVDFRNNVIYNWKDNSAYGGENGEYNMVNNYYKPGPATASNKNKRIMQVSKETGDPIKYAPGYGTFYIAGNYVFGNTTVTTDNWNGGVDFDPGLTKILVQKSVAFETEQISSHTAVQAYDKVLLYTGASFKRDAVDTRIIKEVKDGTYTYKGSKTNFLGIIDTQEDVGGWPVLVQSTPLLDTDGDGMPDDWEKANHLDHTKANANGRNLSTAYDNVEVYINSLVKEITDNQYK